jgi:hypothetical protein
MGKLVRDSCWWVYLFESSRTRNSAFPFKESLSLISVFLGQLTFIQSQYSWIFTFVHFALFHYRHYHKLCTLYNTPSTTLVLTQWQQKLILISLFFSRPPCWQRSICKVTDKVGRTAFTKFGFYRKENKKLSWRMCCWLKLKYARF